MSEEINNIDIEEDEDVIILQSEDGEEVEFNHIATLDYKDEWYIFVQPVELGDMEEDEMLIFKIESDEDGNDIYVPVEDEDTLNAVYAEFEKEFQSECDCEDCDCDECECDENCECEEEEKKDGGCGCGCGCNSEKKA